MDKTIHLCTIFDSNYLDKGLVLYNSLKRVCDGFMLYFFVCDRAAKDILYDLKLTNVIVVGIEKVETEELLRVKETRTKGEYCWTCTPAIIKYVLEQYKVDCCTYIDADMFFYQSPQILLDEFYESGKSVGLVEHRFPDTKHGRARELRSGKYCVQFNTFMNDEKGRRLLEQWRLQCLANCSLEGMGDQLYLTDWGEKYEEVHEYAHLGGGVAPWNLANYRLKEISHTLYIYYKGRKYELIFYHFQNMRYSDDGRVKINVITAIDGSLIRKKTIEKIYYPYLEEIERTRNELMEKYALNCFRDGIGRGFEVVQFNLKKFCKSFAHKLTRESLWSAVDLLIRVLRKRADVISLSDVGKSNIGKG